MPSHVFYLSLFELDASVGEEFVKRTTTIGGAGWEEVHGFVEVGFLQVATSA